MAEYPPGILFHEIDLRGMRPEQLAEAIVQKLGM
jgi:hypothetical protein